MTALMRRREVCQELRISRSQLWRLIDAGKLPAGRVWIPGGRPVWRRCDLSAAIDAMQEQPKRRSA